MKQMSFELIFLERGNTRERRSGFFDEIQSVVPWAGLIASHTPSWLQGLCCPLRGSQIGSHARKVWRCSVAIMGSIRSAITLVGKGLWSIPLVVCFLAVGGCSDETKPDQKVASTPAADAESLASSPVQVAGPSQVEIVLLLDEIASLRARGSAARVAAAMQNINLDNVPPDFSHAYRLHTRAWQVAAEAMSPPERAEASAQISATFADVKAAAQRHGARLPEEMLPADTESVAQTPGASDEALRPDSREQSEATEGRSPGTSPVATSSKNKSWVRGSSSCATSGLGPGNTAECGELATSCITTGLGPGNDAACGGLATSCTTTGLGAGNAAACGGLATSCTTTGLGAGNAAACGGLATSCTTTGLGEGNDAACGGRATSCTTTGLGTGNAAACGGLATSCTTTGLGAGNAAACGGMATSCESVGDVRVCGGRHR